MLLQIRENMGDFWRSKKSRLLTPLHSDFISGICFLQGRGVQIFTIPNHLQCILLPVTAWNISLHEFFVNMIVAFVLTHLVAADLRRFCENR
jgi:hypothetical protein